MKLPKRAAEWSYYVEKYLFPLYFSFISAKSAYNIWKNGWWEKFIWYWGRDWRQALSASYNLSSETLLIIFNVMVGVFLVMAKKPERPPERPRDILVPFAATFFYVAYGVLPPFFPALLLENPFPVSARGTFVIASWLLMLAGLALNIFSLYHLRRSFAVFVQVKKVVFSGPYAFIRHPMYTSHLLMAAGLVLYFFSPAIFAIWIAHAALLAYRARLEEEAIAAHDPGYRGHMARTGFLVPL